MYSCFVHLLYLYRLSWANVIKWKGSLRSPSLFTPDLIVVVLSIYIRRELSASDIFTEESDMLRILVNVVSNRLSNRSSKLVVTDLVIQLQA